MNCKDYEERVFTYKELSEEELAEVHMHLKECINCSKLMDQVKELNCVIAQASSPQPKNAAALTHRIMESLPQVRSTGWRQAVDFFNNTWVQYSLRVTSMVLVLFFVFETVQSPMQLTKVFVQRSKIEFDSRAFLRRYQQNRIAPKTITYFARYQKMKQSSI
jgi:predicted anti-sigma-YlaC factor YlaD